MSEKQRTKGSARFADWRTRLAEFEQPQWRLAIGQLLDSLGPWAALWALMYWVHERSFGLALVLAVLAGVMLVRIFIIFHDCGHGSFFKSRGANRFWGVLTGVVVFTPFRHWTWMHAVHHARSSNLNRRGFGGEIDMWTVEEYDKASPIERLRYRVERHPLLLFTVGPLLLFMVQQRFPSPHARRRERRSVWGTNLLLVLYSVPMVYAFGFVDWFLLQAVSLGVGAALGVWMFYVQHQFEGSYWAPTEEWDFVDAALRGSSYYKLPKVLQWLTGNIGFHHVHHLSPRIANYNLERCHRSVAEFSAVSPLTMRQSLRATRLRLWDDAKQAIVTFEELEAKPAGMPAVSSSPAPSSRARSVGLTMSDTRSAAEGPTG